MSELVAGLDLEENSPDPAVKLRASGCSLAGQPSA